MKNHEETIKEVEAMRIDSRERRRGTHPVYSPSCSLLLTAPPLLAPRCAAYLLRLRRESSLRRPAPSSLVVPGGGRSERRAGRRRTGHVRAPFFFKPFQITHLTIHSISLMQSKNKLLKKTISKRKEYLFD